MYLLLLSLQSASNFSSFLLGVLFVYIQIHFRSIGYLLFKYILGLHFVLFVASKFSYLGSGGRGFLVLLTHFRFRDD